MCDFYVAVLLERMDGQIGEFGSQMAAILKEVQAIQQPTTTGVIHQGLASSDTPGPIHRSYTVNTLAGRWAVASASRSLPALLSTVTSAMRSAGRQRCHIKIGQLSPYHRRL